MDGSAPSTEVPPGIGYRPLLLGLARTLLTTAAVLVLYYVLPLDRDFHGRTALTLLAGLVAVGLLVAWQVRSILRSRHPGLRAVESVALSVPVYLVLFAAVYVILQSTVPSSFNEPLTRTDALYFVITTFTTVGFGDIHPVSQLARGLTTIQMVGDLVLIGLVLRVFLAAVDRGRRRTAAEREPASADQR